MEGWQFLHAHASCLALLITGVVVMPATSKNDRRDQRTAATIKSS
jgi:hypothetical protein